MINTPQDDRSAVGASETLVRLAQVCDSVAADGKMPTLAWFAESAEKLREAADALTAAQRLMPFVHHDRGCMGGVCRQCFKLWSHTNEWHFEHEFAPIGPCECGLDALLPPHDQPKGERSDPAKS